MKRYVATSESEVIPTSGNVGIWWFYNNKVVGEYCPTDEGVDDHGYIQFSKVNNHITLWGSTIKEQLPEALELLPKGYRSIERGRVVYNIRSQVYEIVCSYAVASNESVIKLIAQEFEIDGLRYDVIPSAHYYVPNYTGNQVLDNFDYGD